jgi:hypothetical protein
MMAAFHARVGGQASTNEYQSSMSRDMATMQTIGNIYDAIRTTGDASISHGNLMDLNEADSVPDCTYRWPLIDEEIANAVEKQLRESVSIYDNGGVFGEFEHAWKKRHDLAESFALLHNSGTNALQALYFAAQFRPGDEVGAPPHLVPLRLPY